MGGTRRGGSVLLTGAGGQLAADLAATFTAAGHEVHSRRREDLDIEDERAVRTALDDVRPSIILNPAAYNRVDDAETDAALAFAVNAYGPRVLARASADAGAALVHYSTDYVVDGTRRRPYTEADAPLPLSAYATSKLCGEYFVRALAPRHYVLRVCGLFGPAGRHTRHGNFVETMLRVAVAGRALRVVADQIVAPTSTHDVAIATLELIAGTAPYGLYNCTARGETSWYDYARTIFEVAGVAADLSPTTAAEYGAPARRPAYSILDNGKLEAAGVPRPRHWREALVEYLTSRQPSAINRRPKADG
jgi:dTDP-4-dehydrorhamnose reductase